MTEAKVKLSIDEKLTHLMSDEDDFLPVATGGDDDGGKQIHFFFLKFLAPKL